MSDIEAGGQPKPRTRGKHRHADTADPEAEHRRLLIENLGEGAGIYDRVGISFGGRRLIVDPCFVCQCLLLSTVLGFVLYVLYAAVFAARGGGHHHATTSG